MSVPREVSVWSVVSCGTASQVIEEISGPPASFLGLKKPFLSPCLVRFLEIVSITSTNSHPPGAPLWPFPVFSLLGASRSEQLCSW